MTNNHYEEEQQYLLNKILDLEDRVIERLVLGIRAALHHFRLGTQFFWRHDAKHLLSAAFCSYFNYSLKT
jgi:hypothetical protein